jgi:hypothetical protein
MTWTGRKVPVHYVENDMQCKISCAKYTAYDADRLIFRFLNKRWEY